MIYFNRKRTTRRKFLKGIVSLLTSSMGAKAFNLFNSSPAYAQAIKKRIYIALDDHTDYMWTADEATYRQAFLQMLDYYLNLADSTANNPPEFQSRFNCDGSLWVWTYEKNKSPAAFNRLINQIRSGHISMPLTALVILYGGMPAEAVLRSMYYPGQLERRHNLRFTLAVSMENQTLPYGLSALWAGAGAKYSWKGICGCASQVSNPSDRQHDIYWYTGPDGSRILMKWNSMLVGNSSMGGYAEARDPTSIVDYVDSDANFIARYPFPVIGAFGKGWDDLKTLTREFVDVAIAKTNANRQVIVSNEQDFFQEFESKYGSSLPSLSESYGNEWELYCASMAEVTARVRRATEKLRSAEGLATLVSLKNTSFMNNRTSARDLAWMDLGLYFDHDWTADGQVSRNARRDWQRRLAGEIETYVDTLQADAATALGGLIQRSGTNQRFFAFNPLSWMRTDYADFPFSDTNPVHVIDLTTGLETPSQIVTIDGKRYLRVLAKDVPSVGYKVFEIHPGAGQSFTNAATVNGSVIENKFYRVSVAENGAITSLIDKMRGNREVVRTINGRTINDLGAGAGSVQVQLENEGPVSVTLIASASSPLVHTSRITFFRDSDRIDLRNDINQNFNDIYTWGFGFELNNPEVWHEEIGAIIKAKLLDQGGNYSPRNARYDWLSLNHFADINGGGTGVTVSSADCNFMKLGNSSDSLLDTGTPQISPLVGGQVDGPTLGIPNQGGDTHFLQRFALRTHDAFDAATAMSFSLEHQNPFVTGIVTGGSAYPDKVFSLLSIDNPNVLLWALKPAEDGITQGIITRFWNLAPSPVNFSMSMSQGAIDKAMKTTHIETTIGQASISNGNLNEALNQWQIGTYLISLSGQNFYNVFPFIRRH